jgi:cytochrome c-type biogenesis protein CcmH/NrfF
MSAEIIVSTILTFAVIAVVILIITVLRAFKSPTIFYASEETTDELVTRLSCPKCRSRRLKASGPYTLECENCGFTFSVGVVKARETV